MLQLGPVPTKDYEIKLNVAELSYLLIAVERMAPLAHRPEATLNGAVLAKLRAAIIEQ